MASSANDLIRPLAARLRTGPWPAVALGLLCFLTSLPNRFTYDDKPIIERNAKIRDLADWRAIWLSDWWRLPEDDVPDPRRDRLYRPLTLFSFALNYAAGGLNPLGYHAANVALHALACALVWLLALRLFDDRVIAAFGAALFAVHPVHAEAVANLAGRAEILAALFLMLGLLTLLPRPPRELTLTRTILAAGLFLTALLAKETAICYPALALIVLHYAGRTRRDWRFLARFAVLLAPLLIYFPLRIAALEGHLIRAETTSELFNPYFKAGQADRVAGAFEILGHYTRLLLSPASLSCDYGLAIIDPRRGFTPIGGLGVLALLVWLVALAGYCRKDGIWRRVALCAALLAASYALISNTVLLIGVSLAERLMYWPTVPALIGAGLLAHALHERLKSGALQRVLPWAGVALLVALGLRTTVRNYDWYNNTTLFATDSLAFPDGVHLAGAYSTELIRVAEQTDSPDLRQAVLREAARVLDHVIAIAPRVPLTLHNRGCVYMLEGDLPTARRFVQRAWALNPGEPATERLLAKLEAGHADDLDALKAAAAAAPNDPRALEALGRALLRKGDRLAALAVAQTGAQRFPDDLGQQHFLGEMLVYVHRPDEARVVFERNVRRWPDDWQAFANLALLYGRNDRARCLENARKAYELKPDDIRTVNNLAEALVVNDRPAEAIALIRRIVHGLPADDPLRATMQERLEQLQRGR